MDRLDLLDENQPLELLASYRQTMDELKSRQLVAEHSISTKQSNTSAPYDIEATTNANLQSVVIQWHFTADNADNPLISPFVQVSKTDGTIISPNNQNAATYGIQTDILTLKEKDPRTWTIIYAVLQNVPTVTLTYRYKLYIYSTDTGKVTVVGSAKVWFTRC